MTTKKVTISLLLVFFCTLGSHCHVYASDARDIDMEAIEITQRGSELTSVTAVKSYGEQALNTNIEVGPDAKSIMILISFSLVVLARLKMIDKSKKP